MAFRVGFDGEWHEKFDDREEAFEWAREVGETGRIVFVAEGFRLRLVAIFPEDRKAEGERQWENDPLRPRAWDYVLHLIGAGG